MVEKNESKNFEMFSCAIIEKRHIIAGECHDKAKTLWKKGTDEQIIQ